MTTPDASLDALLERLIYYCDCTAQSPPCEDCCGACQAAAHLRTLTARVRELEADKERLDWIAMNALLEEHNGTPGREAENRQRLNDAVDAARKGKA